MSEPKLPKRVLAVIERCRRGEALMKSFRNKTTGETEVVFSFHPSTRRAGTKSAEEAIASGLLQPARDGLFDDGSSQTWRAP